MTTPDYQNAHTDTLHLAGRTRQAVLRPGGYLVAVTAEIDLTDGWPDYTPRDEPIKVEITDWPEVALYGSFEINHIRGFHQGGIVFSEPLPNVNSATPYVLKLSDNTPPLRVYAVNCWQQPQGHES